MKMIFLISLFVSIQLSQETTVQSIFESINNAFKTAVTDDQIEAITEKGLKSYEEFILKAKQLDNNELGQWIVLYRGLEDHVYQRTERADAFIDKQLELNTIDQSISGRLQMMLAEFRKREFAIGTEFPALPEQTTDINQKPVKLSDYKGKVVLLDFWATWCSPCLSELPNVKAAYKKYQKKGFEILGISLDNTDRESFLSFIKTNGMTWRHIYDGKGWQSVVSSHYGIDAIPATFILQDGKILAKNLRGPQLDAFLSTLFN